MSNEYFDGPHAAYDFGEDLGVALFVRVCQKCGRFVKPGVVTANQLGKIRPGPNAECKRDGPVEMPFLGWF